MKPTPFTRRSLFLLTGWLMLATGSLRAAGGGFTATLALEQQTAAGVTTLTADERTALDQLVADDLAFARRENLTDLGGTFVARRTAADRKQAGLDRLAPEQLAKLNELVAAALAARPTPKERPRLRASEVLSAKRRGEIHGSVTVMYGWGRGGRDYRAGTLWLDYQDPEGRFGLGLGLSTSDGDGFYGYDPGYYFPGGYHADYYPGYYDSRYYAAPRVYLDTSYRTDDRGDFSRGGGSYLCGPRLDGHGGGRRR
jgi:hypothetical protein